MPRFHEQVMGVYFDDLDPMHVLHNSRYLLLFERTMGSFWQQLGLSEFQVDDRWFHVVRANTVEYLAPVRGIGQVRVRVWIQSLGRTSMTFGFRMMPLDEDRDHASGTRTIVHVLRDTWKPEPWSDAFRERLAPWLESGDGA